MTPDPSYLLGYHAALNAAPESVPANYTPEQRSAFVGGFPAGARDRRDRRDRELIGELKECGRD